MPTGHNELIYIDNLKRQISQAESERDQTLDILHLLMRDHGDGPTSGFDEACNLLDKFRPGWRTSIYPYPTYNAT